MWIQKFDPEKMSPAYDILCQGIGLGNGTGAPFSATWCWVEPGKVARAHKHHEHESFLVVRGRGHMRIGGEVAEVGPGDTVLMRPFEVHELTNLSSDEPLLFLDLCWERPAEALERNEADLRPSSRDAGRRRRVLVTATPPTPNGDLHVGHLSGPYLGADVYARYIRLRDGEAVYLSGADDHQSYVVARARKDGSTAREVADRFGEAIPRTLTEAGMAVDHFALPKTSPHHVRQTQEVFRRLYDQGAIVAREVPTLFCDQCRIFLFEAHVVGLCPHCGAGSNGNACEACGWPNDSPELIAPRCRYCEGEPSRRQVRRLFFPLAPYADALRSWWGWTPMSTHLRCLCESMLAKGLPEIAVSHPADWGIPVPIDGFEDQRIYVWFEMAPGYLAATQEVLEARGEGLSWRDVWQGEEWEVVQFFGFDNGYFHAVLFPSIFLACDPAIRLPSAFVVNEFYRYEGSKFSTSRQHALWGPELLAQVPADVARFYLAWDGPEREQSNFRLQDLQEVVRRELVHGWETWLRGLGEKLETSFGSVVPAPGAWTRGHQRFFHGLAGQVEEVAAAYEAETFSPQKAVRSIAELVRSARRFGKEEEHLARIPGRFEEWRTAVALELAAARLLALLAAPLMPGFARELWLSLGEAGEPASWPDVPALVPAGTEVRGLSRAWFSEGVSSDVVRDRV
jgi:methionyl-tRNA synthetase